MDRDEPEGTTPVPSTLNTGGNFRCEIGGKFGSELTAALRMKSLYCWRCRADMPMLDETEWATIHPLLSRGLTDTMAERERTGAPLSTDLLARHFKPALEAYECLTGFHETNGNALWHHRLSLYGPPCPSCGKLLRTPQARYCPVCGWSSF